MSKRFGLLLGILLLATMPLPGNIVNIYSDFICCTGGGAPYSNLVGSFVSPDVLFLTDNALDWHPFSLVTFGADILGTLDVASTGTYNFTLNSDDGSRLFIDGNLVVDHGGLTPVLVNISGSATLSAGAHSFEVQFFECCLGDSGVDLYLPEGVTYAPVPEPNVVLLLGAGFLALRKGRNRRRL